MESVKITGIEDIIAKMDKLGRNLKQRSGRRIIRAALTPMLESAQSMTRQRAGQKLKSSWSIYVTFDEKGQAKGYVRNKAFYALFVEYGHKMVAVSKQGRRGKWGGNKTKHVTGFGGSRPMLRPAFDAQATRAIDIAAQELRKSLDGAIAAASAGGRRK